MTKIKIKKRKRNYYNSDDESNCKSNNESNDESNESNESYESNNKNYKKKNTFDFFEELCGLCCLELCFSDFFRFALNH
jgi:hypothetical protein